MNIENTLYNISLDGQFKSGGGGELTAHFMSGASKNVEMKQAKAQAWKSSLGLLQVFKPTGPISFTRKSLDKCNGLAVLLGTTTSVPKSALHYELDKVSYPDLESCSLSILFSQVVVSTVMSGLLFARFREIDVNQDGCEKNT